MSPLVSYLGVRVRVLGFILKVLVLFCLPRVYAFAFLGFFPYPAPFISCELVCFFCFHSPHLFVIFLLGFPGFLSPSHVIFGILCVCVVFGCFIAIATILISFMCVPCDFCVF